ncbi:hypothetical protein IAT40_004064 [Kwoniella sp. CBS 6097]
MSLIGRFEHLPNRPRADEARPLLEKIASQVKPIMSKRGWKVGTLAEFIPPNPSLLGLNHNAGQRIQIRLRPPGAEHTFYEYDQLVLVMLHELTHNVHGPHDAKFYKLLGELEEEYYDLKRKGYSGEGFHSSGNKLNGLRVNEYEGRAKGLAAAEKRIAQQRAIGRGGKLGGTGTGGKSMKELVAEAAERRLRDDKSCQAGSSSEVEAEVKRAQDESIGINAVDLDNTANEGAPKAVAPSKAVAGESAVKSPSPALDRVDRDAKDAQVIDLTTSSDDDNDHQRVTANSSTSGGRPSQCYQPGASRTEPTTQINNTTGVSRMANGNQPKRKLSPSNSSGTTKTAGSAAPSSMTSSTPTQSSQRQTGLGPEREPSKEISSASNSNGTWTCSTCTLINPPSAKSCEACTTPRSGISVIGQASPAGDTGGAGTGIWTEEGWFCEFCGDGPRDKGYWSCAECGWVRKWG